MANANVPNSIQQSTPVSAPPVEQNFRYIEDFLNSQVVHADGMIPFTTHPTGPSGEPTADRQYANKAYVDRFRPLVLWHVTRTTDSAQVDGGQVDLGSLPRGSITIPDLVPGQGIRFSAFLPRSILINKGGWPVEGAMIEYRLRVTKSDFSQNNGKMLLRAHSLVGPARGFLPEATPPIYAERTFWDPSELGQPGETIYVKSFGGLSHGGGAFKFMGDADRPWQIRCEIVG